MKHIPLTMVIGIIFSLIFLQFSCAPKQEHQLEEPAVAAESPPEGPMLLADRHKAAGIECNDCHEESPPAMNVPEAACLVCHEDYRDQATSYADPHNAHLTFPDCGDCHHAHRASENQCLACHSFGVQAP